AGGSETRQQICLHIGYGLEHRAFAAFLGFAVVKHVRVRIDQTGQDRRIAEIDHANSSRNANLTIGTDIGDFVAIQQYDLLCEHLSGLAVEETTSPDGDRFGRRRTFVETEISRGARLRPDTAPRSLSLWFLCPERGRYGHHAQHG